MDNVCIINYDATVITYYELNFVSLLLILSHLKWVINFVML
jgi:hypothetical protein